MNGRNRAVCMSCGKKTRRPHGCKVKPENFRCRDCFDKAQAAAEDRKARERFVALYRPSWDALKTEILGE